VVKYKSNVPPVVPHPPSRRQPPPSPIAGAIPMYCTARPGLASAPRARPLFARPDKVMYVFLDLGKPRVLVAAQEGAVPAFPPRKEIAQINLSLPRPTFQVYCSSAPFPFPSPFNDPGSRSLNFQHATRAPDPVFIKPYP